MKFLNFKWGRKKTESWQIERDLVQLHRDKQTIKEKERKLLKKLKELK